VAELAQEFVNLLSFDYRQGIAFDNFVETLEIFVLDRVLVVLLSFG